MRYLSPILAAAVLFFSCNSGTPNPAGTSSQSSKELTLTIPLVTWGGYAALFAANGGTEPSENSLFYKYGKFKVKLTNQEDAAYHIQGYANGTYQIIWSTMDMLPMLHKSQSKDPRTSPKVIGLFDYSNGGDGIIVRGDIKKLEDLKGKKIVAAGYTPSHFFLMWNLNTVGLTQADVIFTSVSDALTAKDTFLNQPTLDACVTWSPFIYNITDPKQPTYVKGSSLLTTSAQGNPGHGAVADVYLARADFVKNNPQAVEAFTKAMVEGAELFKKPEVRAQVASQMASLFNLKRGAEEAGEMFADVIIAGAEENKAFFTGSGPSSAAGIFNLAAELYQKNEPDYRAGFPGKPEDVIASEAMLKALK